ncbi:MAG TPA: SPFH domain-containing protein [Lentisphaeria bacterium]|nr:hypothetical protein [Lentisphaerota bacterium]OQC14389.1 MAG: Modulator of FtsH protease HflK [Lentisphaerae bacterium ADurb.Bin082]HPY89798.1 SPFH domain-containing protein [Lentisphaeria bacterium]HQL86765.1 SPFH domain-containing protein [Lentisphaeria bacterium]
MEDKEHLTPPAADPVSSAAPPDTLQSSGMQALMRMLRILFQGLRVLIIIIFVYLLFSGMFRVDDQNEAMLFRFGALQTRVIDPERGESPILTSGKWYWAWPYPVDWVKEIPAQKSVTVSTGEVFLPRINPSLMDPKELPPAENFLRPGSDGYLISGDTNILHTRWEVNFRIVNSAKYYLNFYDDEEAQSSADSHSRHQKHRQRGTEAIIRNLLTNAALAEMATWRVEDLLATSRTLPNGKVENIKDKVQERLLDFLEEVDLGVQVQSVNLIDLQPPLATMEAFRKVNEASETGRAEVLKAKSYAESVVLAAQGNAYRIVDEAKSYRTRVVESVKADSAYFEAVLAEYRKNPETMLTALYTDALRLALAQAPNKYIVHSLPGGSQEIRLQIGQVPEKNESATAPAQE